MGEEDELGQMRREGGQRGRGGGVMKRQEGDGEGGESRSVPVKVIRMIGDAGHRTTAVTQMLLIFLFVIIYSSDSLIINRTASKLSPHRLENNTLRQTSLPVTRCFPIGFLLNFDLTLIFPANSSSVAKSELRFTNEQADSLNRRRTGPISVV